MDSLISVLLFGTLLGLHHALDADHVIAVSTVATRERSLPAALRIAAFWGMGHALTVLVVGGAIILFGTVVPPRLGLGLEFTVALMLMVLGLANLTGSLDRLHRLAHARAGTHVEASRSVGVLRPLGVGIVHGLSGSAAVALLVLASAHDPELAMLGLFVFVVGTLLGMVALSAAFAGLVAYAASRMETLRVRLARGAGALSFVFGLALAVRIGFVDGLFR